MGPDDRLRATAERQHAAASRAQASAAGLNANAVAHRIERGEWVPSGRRCLRSAAAPVSDLQRVMVAVLDAGTGAFASHGTAAALWELPGFTFRPLEVTRARPTKRRTAGSVEHRPLLVLPHHVTERHGIPCSTLPRTIFDLAGSGLPGPRVLRLVSTVIGRSPAMANALHRTLGELAASGRPGISLMREVLAEHPPGAIPPTGLERRFESLLQEGGQPPLRRQVDTGGHSWVGRADYLDDDVRLLVEVDSERYHSSPADRARDAARDEASLAAGHREVLRIPEEWVWWQPWLVAPAVRDARARCRKLA